MLPIAQPTYYSKTLYRGISTQRALTNIDRISSENAFQVRGIAEELKKQYNPQTQVREICEAIWHIIRDNVVYTEDSQDGETEVLRTPARMFADKQGDCDCFTIGISAILKCLGIPHLYRIVAYDAPNKWQHIYPVALCECGKSYAIDCVPEVIRPLQELPYINFKNPEYEAEMKTIELGSAKNTNELENFRVFTDLEVNATEQVPSLLLTLQFVSRQLAFIEAELQNITPSPANAKSHADELEIVHLLRQIEQGDIETLKEGLANVLLLNPPSAFVAIYSFMLRALQVGDQPMNFDEYVQSMQELAPARTGDELGFVGAIVGAVTGVVGQFKASKDAKLERAFQEQMSAKTAEENTRNREFELQKLAQQERIAQIEAQKEAQKAQKAQIEAQKAQAENKVTNNTEPDKPSWISKNWWIIAIAVAGVVILIIFVSKGNKAQTEMQGAKRKKRRRKTQKNLEGAKKRVRTYKRKRRSLGKAKRPSTTPPILRKKRNQKRAKALGKRKTNNPRRRAMHRREK